MTRRIASRIGASLLAATMLATAACGSSPGPATEKTLDRPATFAAREITWAQGTTIHYGDRTFAVPGDVDQLWRSSYGFIVALRQHENPEESAGLVFFDGKQSTELDGEPADIAISPDGRYAGWIDFDGPKRPMGRLAEVVVTDLRTGRELFRNHEDMGSATDDLTDLYEDAEVHFLGFDDRYAYWDTPTGDDDLKRARLGSWKVEPAGRVSAYGADELDGQPYDALVGFRTAMAEDGRVSHTGDGFLGFRSPEGRWCFSSTGVGRLRVVDCRTAATVTPTYPARSVFFGGWSAADTFYVLARRRAGIPEDPGQPDRSVGVLASCRLPSGACRPVRRLTATESVVFAIGPNPDD